MSDTNNIKANVAYYDELYANRSTQLFAQKLKNNLPRLFDTSRQKLLSMGGFYFGGFQHQLANKKILEIGAGNGLNACFMAHFGGKVFTQDISVQSERNISQLSDSLNLDIQSYSGDLRELPFQNRSFDFIVGKSIIHHLTHELEEAYLQKIAQLLQLNGEVRFVEPAHNRPILRKFSLLFPSKKRPSSLRRKQYAAYKQTDPHPIRDNSTKHYINIGKKYFKEVEVTPYGMHRMLLNIFPRFMRTKSLTKMLHRFTEHLPRWVSLRLAKVQIITYKVPLTKNGSITSSAPEQ